MATLRRWTKEEDDKLRAYYKKHENSITGIGEDKFDLNFIAKELNRTYWAVVKEASILQLTSYKRPKAYYKTVRWLENKKGCWIWQLALSNKGYGVEGGSSTIGTRLVHIKNYEKKYGKVPIGLELDHKCRIRKCVNPDHLEAVTHQENISRARINSLLSEAEMFEIFDLRYKNKLTHERIGRKIGVGRTTITAILNGVNQKRMKQKWLLAQIIEVIDPTAQPKPHHDLEEKSFKEKGITNG